MIDGLTLATLLKNPLGRSLVTWFDPWPVDLTSQHINESSVWIETDRGRVTFHSNYCLTAGPEISAQMIAHEVAHFLAAPEERLRLPNLGLEGFASGRKLTASSPPITSERLEEEQRVRAYQVGFSVLLIGEQARGPSIGRPLYTPDEILDAWIRRIDLIA
jgi:hypothetical protein